MIRLNAWILISVALLFLSGCDRLPLGTSQSEVETRRKEDEEAFQRADAILADSENYKLDINLSCLVEFFPYSDLGEIPGIERLKIERSRIEKTKDGWGPTVISDVKVNGLGKEFQGSLIASSRTYATIAFGGQINDGATTSLFVVTYIIDLINLKFKRTVSLFPFGDEKVSQGVCRHAAAT